MYMYPIIRVVLQLLEMADAPKRVLIYQIIVTFASDIQVLAPCCESLSG